MNVVETLNRALEFHEKGDLGAAEGLYRQILAEDSKEADALQFLGILCRQLGRKEEGLELLRQAAEHGAGYANTHLNYGNALDEDGRQEEAAAEYRRALEVEPEYRGALTNLGNVLQGLGDYEGAAAALEKVVALEPDSVAARFNLARVYLAMSRHVEVIGQLREAVRINRNADTLRWLGAIQRRYGNVGESISLCRESVEVSPTPASKLEGWLELGHSLAKAHEEVEALACYEKALEIDPKYEPTKFYISILKGEIPDAAPPELIANIYDDYADHFDAHLKQHLGYRTPETLHAILARHLADSEELPKPPYDICDAGCGTGLCGPLFKPWAKTMVGIDLSPKMLRQARLRKMYDELVQGELAAELRGRPGAFDLVVSSDVLIHMGDLQPAFEGAALAIRPGGFFLFSVEAMDEGEHPGKLYVLNPTKRYAHGLGYLRKLIQLNGFGEMFIETTTLRMEREKPVYGHAVLLRRRSV